MSLTPFLGKVLMVDLVKGLSVTFHNQSEKERITEQCYNSQAIPESIALAEAAP